MRQGVTFQEVWVFGRFGVRECGCQKVCMLGNMGFSECECQDPISITVRECSCQGVLVLMSADVMKYKSQ